MLIVSLISWWYGAGFATRAKSVGAMLAKTSDNFSIGLLFRTLFNPFRQIDAGTKGKGPTAVMEAFFARLLSRLVGFFARIILIIVGTIILFFQCLGSALVLILHLLIPVAPVAGAVLMLVMPEIKLW